MHSIANCFSPQIGSSPLSSLFYLVATAVLFLAGLLWLSGVFKHVETKRGYVEDVQEAEAESQFAITNAVALLILALVFGVFVLIQFGYEKRY